VGGSRFVDVAGVTQSGIGTLIVAGVLDADRYAEERASILLPVGGGVVGEELRDAVGGNMRLEGLFEKHVSDGGGGVVSDRARVGNLCQRKTENVVLRGEWEGQDPAQSLLLVSSLLLLGQTAVNGSAHQKTRRKNQSYQSAWWVGDIGGGSKWRGERKGWHD